MRTLLLLALVCFGAVFGGIYQTNVDADLFIDGQVITIASPNVTSTNVMCGSGNLNYPSMDKKLYVYPEIKWSPLTMYEFVDGSRFCMANGTVVFPPEPYPAGKTLASLTGAVASMSIATLE